MMNDYEYNKQVKERDIAGSKLPVFKVLQYWKNRGFNAELNPIQNAPDGGWDLRVANSGKFKYIDVKCYKLGGKTFGFDTPYPYDEVWITKPYVWDNCEPKPEVWILNPQHTHVAIVYPSTREHWEIKKKHHPYEKPPLDWQDRYVVSSKFLKIYKL